MKRGLATFLGVWATVAVLSGCAPAVEPKAPTDAPTFVSLNPCLDAILVELFEPVIEDHRVLALSHYSADPASSSIPFDTKPWFATTGGTAEEVIALQPDVVLASQFIAPTTRAALERAGLRVELFMSPTSVEESAAQVERLGELTNKRWEAKAMAHLLRRPYWPPNYTQPDPPARQWQPASDPSVLLWQSGQIVAGQNTLIAQLIREEGFTNHAETLGFTQADHVSLERVLRSPPDILLVAGTSAGQKHPALSQLPDTLVHFFDPKLFYCGGPSIAHARDELHQLRLKFEDFPE